MKKTTINLSIFLASIIYYSCNYKNKNDIVSEKLVIINDYYESGNLKSIKSFIPNSSILHGEQKFFYPNGKLKLLIEYDSSLKHGLEKEFYPNEQLEHIGFNFNNLEDSIWLWYYNNGVLKAKDSWFNGKGFGEQYKYYPNSNLKEYFFSNLNGEAIYSRVLDDIGNVIDDDGILIYAIYNKKDVLVNQNIEMIVFPTLPRNEKFRLSCKIIYKNKAIETFNVDKFDFTNSYYGLKYLYKKKFQTPGLYRIIFEIKVDEKMNILKRDSLEINIIVN